MRRFAVPHKVRLGLTFLLLVLSLVVPPVTATEIPLRRDGGVYVVPAMINQFVVLDFILDTGASEVCVPINVVMSLLNAGTIRQTDFLPGKSYSLADGSVVRSERFIIREVQVGGMRVGEIPAVITPAEGPLLLGQSFLQRLDSWSLDNRRNVLIIGPVEIKQQAAISEPMRARMTSQHMDCPEHYLGGKGPEFLNKKPSAKIQHICYSGYALTHSGATRTPLASAEHLTREKLDEKESPRMSAFHAEPSIPPADRAEIEDYMGSGYLMGAMAPPADMASGKSQHEALSLANMIPQVAENKLNIWEAIEAEVRELARRNGELYVVTGPIFVGMKAKRVNSRIVVPTHIFKAIYDPQRKKGAAYVVRNAEGTRYAIIAISELDRLTGMNLFPTLSESLKSKAMPLPNPKMRQGKAEEDQAVVP